MQALRALLRNKEAVLERPVGILVRFVASYCTVDFKALPSPQDHAGTHTCSPALAQCIIG